MLLLELACTGAHQHARSARQARDTDAASGVGRSDMNVTGEHASPVRAGVVPAPVRPPVR